MRYRYAAALALVFSIIVLAPPPAVADDSAVTGALIEKLRDKGVLTEADCRELMKPASPDDGQALNRRLIRKLYEKGVLDEESFMELAGMPGVAPDDKAAPVRSAAQGPASPRGSGAAARDAVKPVGQALTAVEQGVARVGRDSVSMKINFFFQGGFVYDTAGSSVGTPPTGDMDADAGNQFSVRRARLYLGGRVLDRLGYKVSFETASSTILRDAYAYLDYIPYARVTVGQYKVPFGYEGPLALAELPVANRSMAGNFIHIPTARDRGVMLSGAYGTELSGLPLGASYWLGVFNGAGMNKADDNDHKDVAARVRVNPLVPGLYVGGSWYRGRTHLDYKVTDPLDPDATLASGDFDKDWDRWAAELEYRPSFAKGLTFMAEYLWQRKNYFRNSLAGFDRMTHSDGWYALAAYRLDGLDGPLRYLDGFEAAARYDYLDEDAAVSDNERYRTTMGLNYYLAKDTRLMLNYDLIHADGRLRTDSLQGIDTVSHELLTTLMQVKF